MPLLLALLLLLVPGAAAASACCLSTSAFGTGRLAVWEDLAVGFSSSLGDAAGDWSERGTWRAYGDYLDREWRLSAWGIYRLAEHLEISGRVPWVITERAAGSIDDSGNGLGDLSLGARWDLLPLGSIEGIPGVALTFGATLPTGRTADESETILGADATGRGAWALTAGVSLEKTWDPFFVRLDAAGTYWLPSAGQRFGPGLDLLLGGGMELVPGLVASAGPRLSLEGARHDAGREVVGSAARELGLGANLAWSIGDHLTLQGGVETAPPVDGLGQNRAQRTTATLGLRWAHFR